MSAYDILNHGNNTTYATEDEHRISSQWTVKVHTDSGYYVRLYYDSPIGISEGNPVILSVIGGTIETITSGITYYFRQVRSYQWN